MKTPPSLKRILLEACGLIILHGTLLLILAKARLLEHLLAPGSHSYWPIVATVTFLLLRTFLYVIGPGWLACRLWFWFARSRAKEASTQPTG
ncbi:MAG: hypothetical protein IPP19_14860 [Verrucomicrobia bacterium]|nr:hypothetical protein [Verrucomicrobiota bacterium]